MTPCQQLACKLYEINGGSHLIKFLSI